MKSSLRTEFIQDVVEGLRSSPKSLPPRYFYDELGSIIFEAICRLPWYGVTRAETRLLRLHARTLARSVPAKTIIELGPGSGFKLSLIAQALTPRLKRIHLVDISKTAIASAAATVASVCSAEIVAHVATFERGLRNAFLLPGGTDPKLVLLLGSSIGNYEPQAAKALLSAIAGRLSADDRLLVGADLVKSAKALRLAYDDPLGITAAFNRNLLVRINRELDADFVLERFTHRAIWNAQAKRIEMHLVSQVAHWVRLRRLRLRVHFERGETIWTENSYKFEPHRLRALGASAGLRFVRQWVDLRDRFALTLYARPSTPTGSRSERRDGR